MRVRAKAGGATIAREPACFLAGARLRRACAVAAGTSREARAPSSRVHMRGRGPSAGARGWDATQAGGAPIATELDVLPGRGKLAPRVCRRSWHVSRGTGAVVARRTLARVLAAARAARAHATHPPTATKTVAAVWAVVVVVARTRRRVAQLWREREHGSLCRTLVGSRTHLLLSFIAIGLLHAACTKVLARSLSTTRLDERRPV